MGLIAVATARSGFQATKWGGDMSNSYAAANVTRSSSVLASLTANQETIIDIQTFIEMVDASAVQDEERTAFFYNRVCHEFKPALDAWLRMDPLNNPEAPPTPFMMKEYVLQKRLDAKDLEDKAVALSNRAVEWNNIKDNYVLNTVIRAAVLWSCTLYS